MRCEMGRQHIREKTIDAKGLTDALDSRLAERHDRLRGLDLDSGKALAKILEAALMGGRNW